MNFVEAMELSLYDKHILLMEMVLNILKKVGAPEGKLHFGFCKSEVYLHDASMNLAKRISNRRTCLVLLDRAGAYPFATIGDKNTDGKFSVLPMDKNGVGLEIHGITEIIFIKHSVVTEEARIIREEIKRENLNIPILKI